MWRKMTLRRTESTTEPGQMIRTDEDFEGDIEHIRTMALLQNDFMDVRKPGVQAMYIEDLNEKSSGIVKSYKIGITHEGNISFSPFAFRDEALTDLFSEDTQVKAQINLAAMLGSWSHKQESEKLEIGLKTLMESNSDK